MSKKISELTAANTVANTDLFVVVVNPSNSSTIETKSVPIGTAVANTVGAVLDGLLVGANNINVTSNSSQITITNLASPQNAITRLNADVGTSVTANADSFAVTITGANGISTSLSSNTLTISANTDEIAAAGEVTNVAFTIANNSLVLTKSGGTVLGVQLTGVANTSQIPANTSDLTNDSGFITTSSLPANTSLSSGSFAIANNTLTITRADSSTADIVLTGVANTSQIPANTSDLTNDSGFITSSSLPANTSVSNGVFTVANGIVTFTRADSSSFEVDFSDATLTAINQEFVNSTANSTVQAGQLFYDDDYFYVATANGVVKRIGISSF